MLLKKKIHGAEFLYNDYSCAKSASRILDSAASSYKILAKAKDSRSKPKIYLSSTLT